MPKMTLEQARKMRDGVLKGDSAIARAWKELISGDVAPPPQDSSPATSSDRGAATLASMRAREEAW